MPNTQIYPISDARFIEDGFEALLHMRDGQKVRAIWEERGNVTAWWPVRGRRKRPIGLFTPKAFSLIKGKVPCAEVVKLS